MEGKFFKATSINKLISTRRYRDNKESLLVLEKLVLPRANNFSGINKKTKVERSLLKMYKKEANYSNKKIL